MQQKNFSHNIWRNFHIGLGLKNTKRHTIYQTAQPRWLATYSIYNNIITKSSSDNIKEPSISIESEKQKWVR